MKPALSNLIQHYPSSGIRHMFDLAADYPGFLNLCNGEPNFKTPEHICEAASEGLRLGMTKYAPEFGIPELKKAVADKYTAQFGFPVEPRHVVPAAGGVEGIMLSLMATVNPGDEVIIPDPAYVCYEGQVQLIGATPVRLPLSAENGFCLTAEQLKNAITPKTRAIIINYPNNPSGAVLTKELAETWLPVLRDTGIYVISDEVYEKIVFDGYVHFSPAQLPELREQAIVVNSLSKTYAMTGWRVGYIVSRNEELMSRIGRMQQPLISCLPGFIQYAAAKAISGPQQCVEEMVASYTRRRTIMFDALRQIDGIKVNPQKGTFCLFLDVTAFGIGSEKLAFELLDKQNVLTTPGTAFGRQGEGFLRLSFANSDEQIAEGLERLSRYFKQL
ncbi:MAG: pyridoxal phosphate-dependent aminotransferase [Oscillospiraceae bacterium]|nr:pyridoxal phosphate-dependent aminotransferase [Oscillospiraceae bacterium]